MAGKKSKRKAARKQERIDVIKNEIIGILVIGLACLGFVVLYANNGSPAALMAAKSLRIAAGDGSAGIFVILAVLGISLMARKQEKYKKENGRHCFALAGR